MNDEFPTVEAIHATFEPVRHKINCMDLCLDAAIDDYPIGQRERGKCRLQVERVENKELAVTLKKSDAVIVARLDRLSRSFIGFARILEFWLKHKITMHLCDMPGGVFEPDNPMISSVSLVLASKPNRATGIGRRSSPPT